MLNIGLGRKILVIMVLIIFVGAGVIPSTIGTIEKQITFSKSKSQGYIQGLIDNASDGDTIYIPSGIYYENIIINKSISLIGEDKNTTIIDGSEIGDVVTVTADWVNVSGFTIKNSSSEYPYVKAININSNFNRINDNIIFSYYGIWIEEDSNSNTIIYNTLITEDRGLDVRGNTNLIKDNIINNNSFVGLRIGGYNNIVKNNIVSDNSMGIHVFYSNTIDGNNISNNDIGIRIHFFTNVTNNIISNNNNNIGLVLSINM